MTFEDVRYTDEGLISALVDGRRWIIPDSQENRYRRALAEWEAGGGEIAPAE